MRQEKHNEGLKFYGGYAHARNSSLGPLFIVKRKKTVRPSCEPAYTNKYMSRKGYTVEDVMRNVLLSQTATRIQQWGRIVFLQMKQGLNDDALPGLRLQHLHFLTWMFVLVIMKKSQWHPLCKTLEVDLVYSSFLMANEMWRCWKTYIFQTS